MKKVLRICICCLLFVQLAMLTGCRAKHTIQFIVDNEEYYTIKTKGKKEISMPEDPIKSGYIFDGWYFDEGVWNEPLTKNTFLTQKLNDDKKVYAKWEEVKYTITYVINGGTHSNQTKYTIEDSFVLTDAIKEGYTFVGWFKDQECVTEPIDKIEKGTTDNFTLYASYRVNQYTISFNSMGGTSVNDITQNYGSLVEEPIAPSRKDCQFLGWYQESTLENKYTFGTMPAENITLYAKWKPLKLDEIIYNTDKKEVNVSDEITPELFDTIYLDSNGVETELSVVVNGNQIPGNTIQVIIIAKSGDSQKQITLTDIRVYGMPELNIGKSDKDFINMTDTLDKDLFQATAIDTFGGTPEIKVFVENSYQAGDIVTIVIQAIDKAGNITEKRLENIKVYSQDDIKLNYIETDSIKKSSYGEEFKANATDSFGEECKIEIRAAEGYKVEGGKTINLYIVAIDKAGNEKQSPLITNIKVYDIPTANLVDEEKGYAITTDTNIDSLFIVTDSFGEELSATIKADKELINDTVVNITVKAVDIVGNIFEKTYTFKVMAYVELYINDVLYKQLFVDRENYILPTTDNNGNDNLIWFSVSNIIYTDSTGKGIVSLDSSNKLYGISFKTTIKGIKDLNEIRNDSTLTYVLTNDIDLKGIEWTPIDFSGVFYGNHHIIKNFKITRTNSSGYYGLFGKNTGVIYNLGVEDFEISVKSSKGIYGVISAGGLVGENYGTIKNSYATGNVIIKSTSYNSTDYVGGLVGCNYNGGTISNSYATGNVTVTSSSSSASYSGGLVGGNGGTISNSYATGNIESSAIAGGLVGGNGGTISNSYATGNVRSSYVAGGLVGHNESGIISNSYYYSKQIVNGSNTNTFGVAKSMEEITSVSFYTNILGWDENIWEFTEGVFPKLKK